MMRKAKATKTTLLQTVSRISLKLTATLRPKSVHKGSASVADRLYDLPEVRRLITHEQRVQKRRSR